MKELVELLKQARRDQEISLSEISEITKIQQRYLEALEAADFDQFPGEVYLKGALMNYAEAVGVDPKKVMELYHSSRGEAPPEKLEVSPPRKAAIPLPRSDKGPPLVYGIVVLALLLAASGYLFVQQYWPKKKPVPPVEQAESPISAEKESEPPKKEKAATPKPSSKLVLSEKKSTSRETSYSVRNAESLKLKLTSSEKCWIELRTDDKAEFPSRTLQEGEKITARAKRQIWIRLGNPPGVKLEINGVAVDETGDQKRPHNYLFVLKEK